VGRTRSAKSARTWASRARGELELGFGDIDPDERHTDLLDETARVGPTLQDAGSWPTQLSGLSAKKWCDAPANERSRGP
jgi:hypothetical protein